MPSFVSFRGKLYPAKEMISLTNKSNKAIEYNGKLIQPGQPFIYEGPDREAVKELMLAGQEFLGQDFKNDPDFLQAVRNRGFNTVDEYLKHIGYDEAKDEKEFKAKASVINMHELPRRHAEIIALGGGKDTSGGKQDTIGGFGDQKLRSPDDVITNKEPVGAKK